MNDRIQREEIAAAWKVFRTRCESAGLDTPTFAASLGVLVGDLLAEWPEELADRWLELVADHLEESRGEVS